MPPREARRAVVTVGGDVTTVLALARFAARVAPDGDDDSDLVIAADQGLALARRLDLDVDVLVGDMDSVDADDLAAVEAAGVEVRRHRTDKDATDLDLALDLAISRGAEEVVVLDGGGPRMDHQVANLLVAARVGRHARVTVLGRDGTTTIVTDARALDGEPGDLVTLLPVFGRVDGVSTTGLLYPLSGEALVPGTSRGVSNELVAPRAHVTVDHGTLLAVQPAPEQRSTTGPRRTPTGSSR